jgi:hypothetical protein
VFAAMQNRVCSMETDTAVCIKLCAVCVCVCVCVWVYSTFTHGPDMYPSTHKRDVEILTGKLEWNMVYERMILKTGRKETRCEGMDSIHLA